MREGKFRFLRQEEVGEFARFRHTLRSEDDRDSVWNDDRVATWYRGGIHIDWLTVVFRFKRIIAVREPGVAHTLRDGVLHSRIAIQFDDSAFAPFSMPCFEAVRAEQVPQDGVVGERGSVERLRDSPSS